ncbi:MAG: 2-oxoacid:acceptor oxidoreductase family protein [Oscillospiraceae bacterium]|nr:2-oxoacid:acceptor oxidoreductase family protein [Oscillospiraceae bacterium]
MNHSILLAGFGGQGVLFAGKFIAYIGMLSGCEVSWLPSYGPEMRGGTANCGVIISETPVGSPIVLSPDLLLAMNLPSYDKFEPAARPGAKIFVDTSLVSRGPARADVETFGLSATKTAEELGLAANIIMTGKLIKETGLCTLDTAKAAMEKTVPPRKKALFDKNIQALQLGMNS